MLPTGIVAIRKGNNVTRSVTYNHEIPSSGYYWRPVNLANLVSRPLFANNYKHVLIIKFCIIRSNIELKQCQTRLAV